MKPTLDLKALYYCEKHLQTAIIFAQLMEKATFHKKHPSPSTHQKQKNEYEGAIIHIVTQGAQDNKESIPCDKKSPQRS